MSNISIGMDVHQRSITFAVLPAGFVLHRALTAWGHACTVIAPSLIPTKSGIQRELLKSKHYLLEFLARRALVYRARTLWTLPHLAWLETLTHDGSPLVGDDRDTFAEYWALFQYKRERRLVLDRRIADRATDPTLAAAVQRLWNHDSFTSPPGGSRGLMHGPCHSASVVALGAIGSPNASTRPLRSSMTISRTS